MRNLKVFIFPLTALLFFASCQKPFIGDEDTSAIPPTNQVPKVKTYTEDVTAPGVHLVVTYNLSYDANDRLVSMVSTNSPGDKFIYQYNGSGAALDIYNSNMLSIHENFYLNSFSFIDSTWQYNDTQDTSSEKYFYNSNHQLVQLEEYDHINGVSELANRHNYFYDASGNLIKETDNESELTYEYSNLLNNLTIGIEFLPRNKYLVKTTYFKQSSISGTLNHTYTFDSSNRLTSEKIVANTGEVVIKSYTY